MHEAREQLGTTLAGAQAEKYTNKDYDETDYLNQYIKDNLPDTKIEGDIVMVDGWAFELDRSVPKIDQDLGKEDTFTYPDLKLEKGTRAEDKLSIPIRITAQEAEDGISKIEIILNGNVVKTFEDCNNSTEEIIKIYTATENGNYSVKVYSKINRTGYITIDEIVLPTPQIGDYVRYIPDTAGAYSVPTSSGFSSAQSIPQDKTLKWQIMSLNDDCTIDLIADKPITTTVYFQGVLGYNNGVYLLNELCKSQYSKASLGVEGRSLDLEDIEKHFNDSGRAARDAYSSTVKYGQTKTYTGVNSYAPDVWIKNDKNASNNIAKLESKDFYDTPTMNDTPTRVGSITVIQAYYGITSQDSYYNDPNFYSLIFDSSFHNYWLASRCTDCSLTYAYFGLLYVDRSEFKFERLFYSSNSSKSVPRGTVRPVVNLPSTLNLQLVSGSSNEWEIVEK